MRASTSRISRRLIESFRRKFEDAWLDTAGFYDFANITATPARRYPLYGIDPELSFVPAENFATRSVPLYDAEQLRIDTVMYKITEPRHADGLIRAAQRGIPVRLITEPDRYRNPANMWQAYHVDRLYMAGVQIRNRAHAGFLHQKSTLLYGQGLTIFGSSNWTNESNGSQYEHNYFTTKTWFFEWFRDNFERKWTNRTGTVETEPFAPTPSRRARVRLAAQQATGVPTSGAVIAGTRVRGHGPPTFTSARPRRRRSSRRRRRRTVAKRTPSRCRRWRPERRTTGRSSARRLRSRRPKGTSSPSRRRLPRLRHRRRIRLRRCQSHTPPSGSTSAPPAAIDHQGGGPRRHRRHRGQRVEFFADGSSSAATSLRRSNSCWSGVPAGTLLAHRPRHR